MKSGKTNLCLHRNCSSSPGLFSDHWHLPLPPSFLLSVPSRQPPTHTAHPTLAPGMFRGPFLQSSGPDRLTQTFLPSEKGQAAGRDGSVCGLAQKGEWRHSINLAQEGVVNDREESCHLGAGGKQLALGAELDNRNAQGHMSTS